MLYFRFEKGAEALDSGKGGFATERTANPLAFTRKEAIRRNNNAGTL